MAVLGTTGRPGPRTWVGVDMAEGWSVAVTCVRRRGATPAQPVAPPVAERVPVACALPAHTAFVRRLRAPFSSLAKAEKVWPSLLDIELPFPLDAAVCQFVQPARTADGQVEVLAVAARRSDVEAWQTRLQAAGFTPWSMDHEALALWALSTREQPLARPSARLVCYVGPDRTALAWGCGPDLWAASGLRTGARELFDPVRGEAARRAWSQRVVQFVRAQGRGAGEPLQWAWCGPGAARPDQLALLPGRAELGAESTVFVHREPETFLARAVVARAVRPDLTACDLLPAECAPVHLQRRRHRQARRTPLALAAAALLLIGINVGWTTWLGGQRERYQSALQRLAVDLSGTAPVPRGQEVLVTERALQEQAPNYQPFRQAFTPSLLGTVRILLEEAAARSITWESLSVSGPNLVGRGRVADWNQGEALAAALGQDGWLTELERREDAREERVLFTLKASR